MQSMTPTEHEKAEWSRLAQSAYSAGHNATGHRFSGAASIPRDARVALATFDSLQNDYRRWLVDGTYPEQSA